jgi:hypothetical protein
MTSTQTPTWSAIDELPRRAVLALATADIPSGPGVYVWFRHGEPVFLGVAGEDGGLRQRVRNDLSTGADLRQSVLRRRVAVAQLGIEPRTAELSPPAFTDDQVAVINDWLRACQLTWIECDSSEQSETLGRELLARHRPLLNQS